MTDQQHCSEVFNLVEGETATLVLDSGDEIEATLVTKQTFNDESGPNIVEQITLTFERTDDGAEMKLTMLDGLYGAGPPEESPFPTHLVLYDNEGLSGGGEIPEPHQYGYVAEVA